MSGIELRGARVVVTGAGSGIGKATALRFGALGAEVACVDVDCDSARRVALECGGIARACDVSDAAAVAELARWADTELGGVEVLVNNAGVGLGGPFLDASVEDWDWLVGVNLNGVAYCCRAFGEVMVRHGRGHVVNIASGAAYMMSRHMAAYCASKAAVLALSRCLRADWADAGVGVSAICPGLINTPIARHARIVGPIAERQERIVRVFGRGHSPDLVARAVVRAVERNLAVVPVGIEAELAYRLLPLLPGGLQDLAARAALGSAV